MTFYQREKGRPVIALSIQARVLLDGELELRVQPQLGSEGPIILSSIPEFDPVVT